MLTAHNKEARPRRASISSNMCSSVTLWALPGAPRVPWVPRALRMLPAERLQVALGWMQRELVAGERSVEWAQAARMALAA